MGGLNHFITFARWWTVWQKGRWCAPLPLDYGLSDWRRWARFRFCFGPRRPARERIENIPRMDMRRNRYGHESRLPAVETGWFILRSTTYRSIPLHLAQSIENVAKCSAMQSKKLPMATSVRLDQEIKDALAKAAADDDRSVTSLIVKILRDWLKSHGYLQK